MKHLIHIYNTKPILDFNPRETLKLEVDLPENFKADTINVIKIDNDSYYDGNTPRQTYKKCKGRLSCYLLS